MKLFKGIIIEASTYIAMDPETGGDAYHFGTRDVKNMVRLVLDDGLVAHQTQRQLDRSFLFANTLPFLMGTHVEGSYYEEGDIMPAINDRPEQIFEARQTDPNGPAPIIISELTILQKGMQFIQFSAVLASMTVVAPVSRRRPTASITAPDPAALALREAKTLALEAGELHFTNDPDAMSAFTAALQATTSEADVDQLLVDSGVVDVVDQSLVDARTAAITAATTAISDAALLAEFTTKVEAALTEADVAALVATL